MHSAPLPRDSGAVIFVGGHARTLLALSHALARHRIPVIHVRTDPESGRIQPRGVRELVSMTDAYSPVERLYTALEALAARWPGALVLPLSDRAVFALADGRERLGRCLRLTSPSAEAAASILDKTRTARIAAELGLPMPRDFEILDAAALETLAPSLPFPLFAKLRDKLILARDPARTGTDLALHSDLASLRTAFADRPDSGSRYIFQEYCPGHDVILTVLMHAGRPLATFQARSLRTVPAIGGVTVLARTEAVDPRLCDQLVRFLQAIGWEGLAQADFRRDPATGRTVLLEVNGRLWGSVSLALSAGCDFPYYLWQLARGETPAPPASYPIGLTAHWAMGDLKRLVHLWRSRPAGVSRLREAGAFLAACRPGVRGMIWRWDDPRPALAEWTDSLRWFSLGAFRRLTRRPLP